MNKEKDIPHSLSSKSSYIVVILKSLRHEACVRCGYPIHTLNEATKHWDSELLKNIGGSPYVKQPKIQSIPQTNKKSG